jgi:hypothetical protein
MIGALALLLVTSAFDAADARRGGRGFHGGSHARAFSGRAFHAPRFHGHRFHAGRFHHRGRHFGRGFIVGLPLAYGAYYYSGGCEWLRRRAIYTGSGYWWSRYQACLDGYYY